MEIAQIVSNAKEKLGETSLSDRSLTNYFTRHLPAEGAEPDDAYWDMHISELKAWATDYTGQHSHEMSLSIEAEKKKWEEEWKKNHPDLKPNDPPKPPVTDPALEAIMKRIEAIEGRKPEPDPAIAALTKQLEEMNAREKANKEAAAIEALIKEIKGKAEDLEINDELEWEDAIDLIKGDIKPTSTSKEVEDMAIKMYEKRFARRHPGGAAPRGNGGGNGGNGGSDSFVQQYLKQKLDAEKERAELQKQIMSRFK